MDLTLKLLMDLIRQKKSRVFDERSNLQEQVIRELDNWSNEDINELQHELRVKISEKRVENSTVFADLALDDLPRKGHFTIISHSS